MLINNRHTWTIGGHPVDIPDGSWNYNATFEGGLDICNLIVSDDEIKRIAIEPDRGTVVIGTHFLEEKYWGKLTAAPRFDEARGVWHLSALGVRGEADDRSVRLLFQSRDTALFKPSDSVPHGYTVSDGMRAETKPGEIEWEIQRGEAIASGSLGKMLAWFPSCLVPPSRIAGTVRKNRDSAEHGFLIRTGTGPSGAMATDGASIGLGSGTPDGTAFSRTFASPKDQVELALEAQAGDITLANNRSITSDEDVTLKSSGQKSGGTHFGDWVAVDDELDSITIEVDVSGSSGGSNRSLEVTIQTKVAGGSPKDVGSATRTGTGTSTITVSDKLRSFVRYKARVSGSNNPQFTFSVRGETSPAKIVIGDWHTLDDDVTAAELILNVSALSGTNKELEIEIQTAGSGQRRTRTAGQFDSKSNTGSDKITVNVHKRVRWVARIYGSNEPSATFSISGKLGYATLRATLASVRVNAITLLDTYSIRDAMAYVGDELGWNTSKISAGFSLNCLPLDWMDNWTEFFIYLATGLIDGWFGVWRRGGEHELRAGLWSESETIHLYRGFGAFPELSPLDTYDDVLVEWENGQGLTKHYPRVADPALRYYDVRLADVQSDDTLAQEVRNALLPDVTEERLHGRIRVTHAFREVGGPIIPACEIRPGMKAEIHDYRTLDSVTLRITDVSYDADGAWVACDDSTSEERFQNRARLVAQRRAGRKPRKR